MKKRDTKRLLFAFSLILLLTGSLTSCSLNRKTKTITAQWKYSLGDNKEWASPDFDTSAWPVLEGKSIYMQGYHFVWLKADVPVSADQLKENLWLGMNKFNGAADFYADGAYIGSRGTTEPVFRVRMEEDVDVNIPHSAVHDGVVHLAARVYCPSDKLNELQFSLDNGDEAFFENIVHNQFGPRFFIVLTFLCVFIMFYSLAVYIGNKENKTYLYFSISLMFIIPYFFDLGSDFIILPYNLHRSLCRACLPVSLTYMSLFLNRFFNRKYYKQLKIAVIIFTFIPFIAYLLISGKQDAMDLMFNIMLLPVVVVIVYGFVTASHGVKMHEPYSLNMFLGFTVGAILALHDVIVMLAGIVPFMWTQALAFFAVDLAIFITLSVRSAKSQNQLTLLAKETEKQHERLSEIFASAQKMASETAQISDELAESVENVMTASRTSLDKVSDINLALRDQNALNEEAEKAITELAQSLTRMNREFDLTAKSIQTTADGTQDVIRGISNVSEGIVTAENFTRSLNSLTTAGSADMTKLIGVIESIQNSSKEILNVVDTLDNFAQQTDLLAMNAAIEAAHTGEAGKGFSVIAHEIKSLAANSSAYASRIGEIITSVIQSIAQSVQLTSKVNQTFAQIKEGAGQSVEKVSAASQSIKEQVQTGTTIARESEQMAASASRMKQNVVEQGENSALVLNNMTELSVATKKVNTASDEISTRAKELAEEVESLRHLAERTRETARSMKQLMATE